MSKPIEEIKTRIAIALSKNNMKPIDLAEKTGIPKSSISQYLSGYAKPKNDRIYIIAKALNVTEPWLMGYDVPDTPVDIYKYDNIYPIQTQKVPLLGEIACGEPILAEEQSEEYITTDSDIKADFCLKCKGDSMIEARIFDNDIVFIKKQDEVENGEIAAVIIDNEATLKRVYYYKDKNMLILKAENKKYDDFIYIGAELEQIRILGKAIYFQSKVK